MHSVTNPPTVSYIQPTLPSIFSHSSSYAHSLLSLFYANIRIPSLTRSNSPYPHTFIYPHSVSWNFSFTPICKLHSSNLNNKHFVVSQQKENSYDILILINIQFLDLVDTRWYT